MNNLIWHSAITTKIFLHKPFITQSKKQSTTELILVSGLILEGLNKMWISIRSWEVRIKINF